jgi:hypothetical protein
MTELVKQNVLEAIRIRVRDHYAKTEAPYLLSTLGLELRKDGLWPSDASENLRSFVEHASDPELQILRNPNLSAKIAITDSKHKISVQAALNQAVGQRVGIGNLPRPIVLAFCTKSAPGQPIFVRREPPNNFQSQLPAPEEMDLFWTIPPSLRLPSIDFVSFSQLSPEDRSLLRMNIQTWAAEQKVPVAFSPAPRKIEGSSALKRLVEAQAEPLRRSLVIPADIALLLSKCE